MKKFRIEVCTNGWLVVVSEGKDDFLGRHVFTEKEKLVSWLSDNIEIEKKSGPHDS